MHWKCPLTSEDCNGGNCEGTTSGICDNIFYFCLRAVGNTSCLASVITNDVQDDSITFSSYDLSRLGISNPLSDASMASQHGHSVCAKCICLCDVRSLLYHEDREVHG